MKVTIYKFPYRRSFHWSALCKIDRDAGAPNLIDVRLFGWHVTIRLPFSWWGKA